MKIFIVGEWSWSIYEESFAAGLRSCGVEVYQFSTSKFFNGLSGRIQKKIPFAGFKVIQLNKLIIETVVNNNPNLILFWRPTHIIPKTIIQLSKMGYKTASYNNDDPFGPKVHGNVPWHHHFLWLWYTKCLPHFNFNFFYRQINCAEANALGAKHAQVLLPYFMPWKDHPVQLTESELKSYDTEVVFVGHYEPDGREYCIRALLSAGIRVKLWGGHYWSRSVLGDLYDQLAPILPAEGDKYVKALSGAKICLCFLSKLNRDTYTRRCFEIPACGKVMLAERTEELMQFFKEDEEACFFSSHEELVRKAKWLINNPAIRERIAQAGLRRVWADGHDVTSRAKYFLSVINPINK